MILRPLSHNSVMSMPQAAAPSAVASERSLDAAAKTARMRPTGREHGARSDIEGLSGLRMRQRLRYRLWAESSLPTVRKCGRCTVAGGVGFLRYPSGQVSYTGTQSCHSVWACPVCSEAILRSRAAELERQLKAAEALGLDITFITFTVRHARYESLTTVLDRLTALWRRVFNGAAARAYSLEKIAWVRTLEITYGENGWHPHYHVLIAGKYSFTTAQMLQAEWIRIGGALTSPKHAVIIRGSADSGVARYLAKVSRAESSLALELHGARGKDAYLLSVKGLFEQNGSYALYREYEQATRGRRQMYRNKHWRALFGDEVTDEEALESSPLYYCDEQGPVQGPAQLLGVIPSFSAKIVFETSYEALLDDLSAGGRAAFIEWFGYSDMDSKGIIHISP